ncbi:protein commissureless 2 homolog isoform X2 [Episyrphus balteatus]|uniref:protein commissureless 2 homolog isoform X2 n=1 Tax=Episyrphus balteatus TaxID=286459 RepID=UPI0024859B05|nr:protein commissureless 2 homolog isoform X2 [Episyrphus balteatus]
MDNVKVYQDNSLEVQSFELPQNYTLLISKLEKLALGLNSNLENLTHQGHNNHHEISAIDRFFENSSDEDSGPVSISLHPHGMTEAEYNRVVSDIWIGVILTLLIVTVIFFICSCFLYHKFQQWKNSYRTSDTLNPGDVIRRYDMDVESLPSYTIVSGLPSYDDALDEFRKAGLILKPPIPVIKIFDSDTKDPPSIGEDGLPEYSPPENTTTCVCGNGSQIIELNPEHLKILSQKRLSLQISFNGLPNNIRRNSRPRVDLCQQVGRNNLLRAQRDRELLTPEIHRSSSMTLDDERNMIEHRLRKLEQHRGSIS